MAVNSSLFRPFLRAAAVSTLVLAACGGGGGGGGAAGGAPDGGTPTTPTAPGAVVSVIPTIDSTLAGSSTLTIAATLSIVDSKPAGSALYAVDGAEVYGVDANGDIAVATVASGSTAVFSAQSTVQVLATRLLGLGRSTATSAQLSEAVTGADSYAELVSAVETALKSGVNPANDSEVKRLFGVIVPSAAKALDAKAIGSSQRAQRQAVAGSRVTAISEPILRVEQFGSVTLVNSGAIVGTLALRSTTSLPYDVTLLDDANVARPGTTALGGSGLLDAITKLGDPVNVPKPFEGSFSVRLKPNFNIAYAAALKAGLLLVLPTTDKIPLDCFIAIDDAVKGVIYDDLFLIKPLDSAANGVKAIMANAATSAIGSCLLPAITPNVSAIFSVFNKVGNSIVLFRMLDEIVRADPAQSETGVCVTRDQFVMNCVNQIVLEQPLLAMRPLEAQPLKIKFLDPGGKQTAFLTAPYGLKRLFAGDATVTISDNLTQVIAGLTEGLAVITLVDPATEMSLTFNVSIAKGEEFYWQLTLGGTSSCSQPPIGSHWYWETPCVPQLYTYHPVFPVQNVLFSDTQDYVILQSASAGGSPGIRAVRAGGWRSASNAFSLTEPTAITLQASDGQGTGNLVTLSASGNRVLALSVGARAETSMSGTFSYQNMSGYWLNDVPIFSSWFTQSTSGTGTWTAIRKVGKLPQTHMGDYDWCFSDGSGTKQMAPTGTQCGGYLKPTWCEPQVTNVCTFGANQ